MNIKIVVEDENGEAIAKRNSGLWDVAEMNLNNLKNWWLDREEEKKERAKEVIREIEYEN